jgi:hypothetical protein
MAKASDIHPDDQAKPTGEAAEAALDQEDDVEGHSMLPNPTVGREFARARSAEVERSVRAKNLEHEAKRVFRR